MSKGPKKNIRLFMKKRNETMSTFGEDCHLFNSARAARVECNQAVPTMYCPLQILIAEILKYVRIDQPVI
jgi:hypothetical protein